MTVYFIDRFEIYLKAILLEPKKVERLVLSTLYLHNFLMRDVEERTTSAPPQQPPQQTCRGMTSLEPQMEVSGDSNCKRVRDTLRNFFCSEQGSVPWQNEYATK